MQVNNSNPGAISQYTKQVDLTSSAPAAGTVQGTTTTPSAPKTLEADSVTLSKEALDLLEEEGGVVTANSSGGTTLPPFPIQK